MFAPFLLFYFFHCLLIAFLAPGLMKVSFCFIFCCKIINLARSVTKRRGLLHVMRWKFYSGKRSENLEEGENIH